MSDVNVYPIGMNKTALLIVGGCVILLGGYLGYRAYRYEVEKSARLETQLAQMSIDFKQFREDFAQARNEAQKNQKELREGLSKDYQEKLDQQKLAILARIDGVMEVKLADVKGKLSELKPGVYSYDNREHGVIDRLIVDATQKPANFDIGFKPQKLTLTGTLNWDEKKGASTFWLNPQTVSTSGGITVNIPELTFSAGEQYNNWITTLRRGKETRVPVMPKYTVNLLGGREYRNGMDTKTVFGASAAYNFIGGANLGAGFIGDAVFVQGGWSFGKR